MTTNPPLYRSHSPAVVSWFLFSLPKGAIEIRCKKGSSGCRVSGGECEQLRGVISQARSPLSRPWLGWTAGIGEALASKGHQQVEDRRGRGGEYKGGWALEKAGSMWPCLGRIHQSSKEDDTLSTQQKRKDGNRRCGESFHLLLDWVGFRQCFFSELSRLYMILITTSETILKSFLIFNWQGSWY